MSFEGKRVLVTGSSRGIGRATVEAFREAGARVAVNGRTTESTAEGIAASRGVARDVLLEFMRSDATPDGPHPYLQRIVDPFVALIEEGQRSGEMRTDYPASFLAQMAVGMLNSAITNWLANPDYPVETGLVEVTEFTLKTLGAAPISDRSAKEI